MGRISAGSYDLNRWLHGGYESEVITVIYGAAGTGKTNFCILAAVSQAKKGNKVLYIDTEGGFSSERVKQLVPENTTDVLKNILLLSPLNFEEQKDVFKKLSQYLKDEISLIIVDGMTMLYRLDMAAAREHDEQMIQAVNSALASQMRTLAEIARKRSIPIMVTNQVYRWDEQQKMVGGDILQYWGKCLLELSHEKGRRTAFLRKHRSLPQSSLDFQIVHEGIKKKGWL